MIMAELVERFEREAPICVMVRALLENAMASERLDAIFARHGRVQNPKGLLFSTVAELMGSVTIRIRPSMHAAYQANKAELGVTVKALYDKLQRIKSEVSRDMVRETAAAMAEIVDATGGQQRALLPGYHVKILDGNHLRRTERRLGVLRRLKAAPLPGHALAVLDPQRKLIIDVFPCEDAHAQERTLLPAVLQTVQPRDVWVADRNFCTTDFLLGILARRAYFVIRQHASSLRSESLGKRRRVGRCAAGTVYEQAMRLLSSDGTTQEIRRITVVLDQPTRDGETEVHILTNLPAKVSAIRVADLYRKRWRIETAFAEMAQNLEGEIVTLGYPKAALFAFSMALVAYNLLSVVQAALRSAHGHQVVDEGVSVYYLADEVAHAHRGLSIAVPDSYWSRTYRKLSVKSFARELLRIARTVELSRYRKHKRGPKTNQPPVAKKGRNHVATARILMETKNRSYAVKC